MVVASQIWQQNGGEFMFEVIYQVLIAVTANLISDFISKWLDCNNRDN
jgi:hypothetical protein